MTTGEKIRKVVYDASDLVSQVIGSEIGEPLDGDEVDVIVELFKINLNLRQGNMSSAEFNAEIEELDFERWFK